MQQIRTRRSNQTVQLRKYPLTCHRTPTSGKLHLAEVTLPPAGRRLLQLTGWTGRDRFRHRMKRKRQFEYRTF